MSKFAIVPIADNTNPKKISFDDLNGKTKHYTLGFKSIFNILFVVTLLLVSGYLYSQNFLIKQEIQSLEKFGPLDLISNVKYNISKDFPELTLHDYDLEVVMNTLDYSSYNFYEKINYGDWIIRDNDTDKLHAYSSAYKEIVGSDDLKVVNVPVAEVAGAIDENRILLLGKSINMAKLSKDLSDKGFIVNYLPVELNISQKSQIIYKDLSDKTKFDELIKSKLLPKSELIIQDNDFPVEGYDAIIIL